MRVFHVPYLDLIQARFWVIVDIDVDGEMRIDVSHFVFESSRNSNDQVIDDGLDGSESGHVLARAMMQFDIDDFFRGVGKADGKMG